jgi:hypothetical protein
MADSRPGSRPLNLYQVLREEYVRLHGPLADDTTDWSVLTEEQEQAKVNELLPALFKAIHDQGTRSALCFSGGGIRSATFALGAIQRLAKLGVLPKFDYLSTVSGGGYIGSWLSSYVRRSPQAIDGVTHDLSARPAGPLVPEVEPLRHLREYSNYLTPKLGLLSGDTWAMAGNYLRNLLLNWLVLIPLIAAFLAIPRVVVSVIHTPLSHMPFVEVVTAIALTVALVYLALTRPVSNTLRKRTDAKGKRKELWLYTNAGFLCCVVAPFVLSAIGIVLLWGWMSPPLLPKPNWPLITLVVTGLAILSSFVYLGRYAKASANERRDGVGYNDTLAGYTAKKAAIETFAAAVSGAVLAALLFILTKLFPNPTLLAQLPTLLSWKDLPAELVGGNAAAYVCFAVPCVLAALFIQSALFVGLSSWFNEDYDREWWARAAGWVLVAGLCWMAFTAITIYGPILIYSAPRIFASIGAVTGLFSVLIGKSGKTGGTSEQKEESKPSMVTNIALALLGPVFVICILSLLALVTSRVLLASNGALRLPEPPLISEKDQTFYSGSTYDVRQVVPSPRVPGGSLILQTAKYPALEKDRLRVIEHLWVLDNTKTRALVTAILGGGLLALLASWFIGVNRFSMHAFYRNRLIRAYLGASRWVRRPNPFSGFDPNDNLPMHKLRPEMFWIYSFGDLGGLVKVLVNPPDGPSKALLVYLWAQFPVTQQKDLRDYQPGDAERDVRVGELLADSFNRILDEHDLRKLQRAPQLTSSLLSLENRHYLDQLLSAYIRPCANGRPLHFVNMALNLVSGEELAWQQRKAESFTASPLHCGNYQLGYRSSRVYGGPGGMSLGTAVAISGAAASPNMGYHSSPALSFLLTLFNVRLGWWLGNPGRAGEKTFTLPNPRASLPPLLAETLGNTTDTYPYIYLSDGGHFENLALYEMVLRRCQCIVVLDAGADETFIFDDLGNAIRKIAIDFGIPIDVTPLHIFPRSQKDPKAPPQYYAIGTIHYEAVDAGAKPGQLLYVKPTFYGEKEPRDVYNYAKSSGAFPHESTADQWFTESQFESYRALGYFAIGQVAGESPVKDVCDLLAGARERLAGKGIRTSKARAEGL